jgi:hypothetical protein
MVLVMTLLASRLGAAEDPVPVLNDLSTLDELRSAFEQDAGQPRVILLLSPT